MYTNQFLIDFSNLVNAGFPYVYIPSYEEDRVVQQIKEIAEKQEYIRVARKVYEWTQTEGLYCGTEKVRNTQKAAAVIEHIGSAKEEAIYILKDFHINFGAERGVPADYSIIRKLRDIIPELKSSRKTVVFVSPRLIIPCDMEKEISILDFSMPNEEELEKVLDNLTASLDPQSIRINGDEKRQLVRAALGLTLQEAENAFCRAIVRLRGLDISALSIIHDEKNQVVKKTGVLEFIKSDLGINDIGGLENLKKWLLRRNNSWSERARRYNLPAPKGVLITGVPGCGKSLTAKAMHAIWGLPLLKLDMGRIFGGLVGSSEENMRKAIATAEAVSPCILWVDEIEKGLSGLKGSGDSGTSARVFGTFLTWMQEKNVPVFIIATANDISSLPPELLRKGRFDEVFFVDLPTYKERAKIFELHINRQLKGSCIDHDLKATVDVCNEFAEMTSGYVGAEIEQIVVSAMYEAFYAERGLRKEDVEKAIRETVPLSITQREQILRLREWAKERAVLATSPEDREAVDAGDVEDGSIAGRQGGRIVDFDL